MDDKTRADLHAEFRRLGYTTNGQTSELLDLVAAQMSVAVAKERERCARAARAAIFSIPADIRMSADIMIHATDLAIGWPNVANNRPVLRSG